MGSCLDAYEIAGSRILIVSASVCSRSYVAFFRSFFGGLTQIMPYAALARDATHIRRSFLPSDGMLPDIDLESLLRCVENHACDGLFDSSDRSELVNHEPPNGIDVGGSDFDE